MTRKERIQPHVENRLDDRVDSCRWLAGIIGDRPSQGTKSPSLWNAAFEQLGIDAVYTPFDVKPENLEAMVNALRHTPGVAGFSVTAPYKISIIRLLDEVDPKARQIGAVNMVMRDSNGRLVGFNTDGQGFIHSLTRPFPDRKKPFLENLKNLRVLLIGAGGAARAVAIYLAGALGTEGHLWICNRNQSPAKDLAASVNQSYGNAGAVPEQDLRSVATEVDLIVNATTKGQAGLRKLAGQRITCLEPYSALGPAQPAEFPEAAVSSESEFYAAWYRESRNDIEQNFEISNAIVCTVSKRVAFVDVVYAPVETVMLRQARLSGHATLNGKGMNIAQAVDGFVNRVMSSYLKEPKGQHVYQKVFASMANVW